MSARIRSSVRSVISKRSPQVCPRSGEVAAHGALRDTQQLRGGGRVEVVPVGQVNDGALTDTQGTDGVQPLRANLRRLPGARHAVACLPSASSLLGTTT